MTYLNSYRVEWFADNQGTRYEIIDAISSSSASQIIEAKYGSLRNFKILSVSPYSDSNRYDYTDVGVEAPKYEYIQSTSNRPTDYRAEFASLIAGGAGLLGFIGLFTISSGGIFLVALGAIIFYLAVTFG